MDSGFRNRGQTAIIYGAQRIDFPSDFRDHTRGPNFGSDSLDHGDPAEGRRALSCPMRRLAPPTRTKPCPIDAASHEMILATSGHIVLSNKKVYICFLMAFAMLAASPSRAAEVNSAINCAPARDP